MNNAQYDLPQACDFMKIWNNSGQEFDCSPKLKDPLFSEFQGILINAPQEVVWPLSHSLEDMEVTPDGNTEGPIKLMVAGLLKLPYMLGLQGNRAEQVVIAAVNQKTAKSYAGKMASIESQAELAVHGYEDSQKEHDTVEYFNIDLVRNLDIPLVDATYHVYATLGNYKSNVVTIKTRSEQ